MQNEELQAMTVVQLRKLARERGVKLSAGIDKGGIVERLSGVMQEDDGESPFAGIHETEQEQTDRLQEAPLSADVTALEPNKSYRPWAPGKEDDDSNGASFQPTYRQAWQARPSAPRQPLRQPSWQPQRTGGTATRFGPQANYQQSLETMPSQRDAADNPEPFKQEAAARLDGYRLGYQAVPGRQGYSRHDAGRHDGYRPYPRPDYARGYQQPPPYTPAGSGPEHYHDSLYKPVRDPAFGESYEPGAPLPKLLQTVESVEAGGVLEILGDGYGFLRADSLLPGKNDIYVSVAQIRRYGLRTGDFVEGRARSQHESDKYAALLYVERLNGSPPEEKVQRQTFDSLIPIYPNRRIVLEGDQDNLPVRLVDLIAPIGFGQRGMIIAPPDSGRLVMLKEIGQAIIRNDPQAQVMMLMIDAVPEEVTEFREGLDVEVYASAFTEPPESQTRVSETILENAQRQVEEGRNIVILLDSLTKLTRVYQAAITQGGRALTNTVTPAALVRPKRFFGMARNTREGGSLTIIATISIDTGSRVDDIIFEEFKGTANMELRLCTPAAGDPVFPMVDLQLSDTKKEENLLTDEEKEGLRSIRMVLGSMTNQEAARQLADMMQKTKSNADLFSKLKDWVALLEKSGYVVRKS
ncbi:MAG: transcription termination factor Rho [Clostridia bacterium]|nr:transcription termination factor Rho [Clostridia bacterium]